MKLKNLDKNKAFWLIKKTIVTFILVLVMDYFVFDVKLDVRAYISALLFGVCLTVWEFYFPAYGKSKSKE